MKHDASLVWFRQDLRLRDNPALHHAASTGAVLPIYIHDQVNAGVHKLGGASKWWLHQSLHSLDRQLGGQLRLFSGDPLALIPKLLERSGIKRIVWNRCYQPWQIARDKLLKQLLQTQGIEVASFNGSLLWEPWDVLKSDRSFYRVFTPYYRNGCLKRSSPRFPLPEPDKLNFTNCELESFPLKQLDLLPKTTWYSEMASMWQPGESGASNRLSRFLQDGLSDYKIERDRPDIHGTSKLSPHLRFGELSPNQVWYTTLDALHGKQDDPNLDCFLSELGWREFSYYLLYHFPELPQANYNAKFNHFSWRCDADALQAWQKGRTGIPIVDAGMRELWQTGHMHNRVRMVVASFLVKNLLLHWQEGEAWFRDCLLDADLASNSASWQWVAGSGADAAPYFRIFNPVTQGTKFDPDGAYVKHYCPELSELPLKYIHQPWMAPPEVINQSGIQLGQDYPHPLVDLKLSRQRALDAFANMKQAD